MKKYVMLVLLVVLVALSLSVSLLYFKNPEHRKEMIDKYKSKVLRKAQ